MTDNDGFLVRLFTTWSVYQSNDGSHIHIQSWRFVRRLRRVVVLSFIGGAHELWAKELKGTKGKMLLADVLQQHVEPSEATEKLKKARDAISDVT
jgi:hypothetical protein